jgi:hypothetical protein
MCKVIRGIQRGASSPLPVARWKKRAILKEIKRVASENGGRPPGEDRFARESGIRKHDWFPHVWLRWSEALKEAGFSPNEFGRRFHDDAVIKRYIGLIRELQRIPIYGEIRRKRKEDESFPGYETFGRFGGKNELVDAAARFCREHPGNDDVLAIYEEYMQSKSVGAVGIEKSAKKTIATGFVYLMKSGRHYKIGRTNAIGRRERELATKIPVPPKTIHSIETLDPVGVEVYWHKRFAEKRGEGEWFELSQDDVKEFKGWRKIV